jgi:RHS repeat-associated protein
MTAVETHAIDTALSLRAVTDSYEYDAFGNEITHTGTTPNNMLYRGEEWDPDLGLYYLRARYYNPLTGRFMSRDPNEGTPWFPATFHKYLYVGGDRVDWWDPTGRSGASLVSPTRLCGGAIGEYLCLGFMATLTVTEAAHIVEPAINNAFNQIGNQLGLWLPFGEHTKGKRKSTTGKHEKGKGRRVRSRGPGTHPKYPPRKRPKGWKGPWNPGKGWGND